MNKQHLYGLINPFERIAGLEALLWGLAGMVVSTALSFYSGWHYHGLLHFGPAPNPAWGRNRNGASRHTSGRLPRSCPAASCFPAECPAVPRAGFPPRFRRFREPAHPWR